jgi:serine/threonine protein kinase
MPRLQNADTFARATNTQIFEKAREVTAKELQESTLFDPTATDDIPCFATSELSMGRVVGRGAFCVVKEITAIKLDASSLTTTQTKRDNGEESPKKSMRLRMSSNFSRQHSDNGADFPNETSREQLARRVWSKKVGGKYVVKQLNPALLEHDKVTYLKGLVDLTLELHYLANFDHNNILGIRGVAQASAFDDTGFFLVLDQLKTTLSKRLNAWMQMKRTTSGVTGLVFGGKRKVRALLVDRLLVAHDVAEGLNYLHSKNVIFRDLVRRALNCLVNGW